MKNEVQEIFSREMHEGRDYLGLKMRTDKSSEGVRSDGKKVSFFSWNSIIDVNKLNMRLNRFGIC